jgi:hypothetical protein
VLHEDTCREDLEKKRGSDLRFLLLRLGTHRTSTTLQHQSWSTTIYSMYGMLALTCPENRSDKNAWFVCQRGVKNCVKVRTTPSAMGIFMLPIELTKNGIHIHVTYGIKVENLALDSAVTATYSRRMVESVPSNNFEFFTWNFRISKKHKNVKNV